MTDLFLQLIRLGIGHTANFHPKLINWPEIKELAEILMPDQVHNGDKVLILRMVSTFRRWKDSAWKHELCYKESMWSSFWYGVCGHLLKPASI